MCHNFSLENQTIPARAHIHSNRIESVLRRLSITPTERYSNLSGLFQKIKKNKKTKFDKPFTLDFFAILFECDDEMNRFTILEWFPKFSRLRLMKHTKTSAAARAHTLARKRANDQTHPNRSRWSYRRNRRSARGHNRLSSACATDEDYDGIPQ